MWNGKNKAITFSYDDGVTQDIRLIEIFNKYGLKSTFNLNSKFLGAKWHLDRDGVRVEHTKHRAEDIKHVYAGHEVAAHTLKHPDLTKISDEAEIIHQVEEDRLQLSELVGYEVVGMAYPGSAPNCNDRVADIVKNSTGIKYARTVPVTKSFQPYHDLYQYKGTLYHHENWSDLFDMGKKFLALETDTPKILYIWGHAYEFDIYPERWEQFEQFCKMMSGKDDIFYGTNKEILL